MRFKKFFLIICIIICLFSIASACASDVNETIMTNENQNGDLIEIENQNDINGGEIDESVNTSNNYGNDINNASYTHDLHEEDIFNGSEDETFTNNQDILGSSECEDEISLDEDMDILSLTSPSSSDYKVSISSQSIYYEKTGTIKISITPCTKSGYYKYDFKLVILDSNNVRKWTKDYSSTSTTTSVSCEISAGKFKIGTYTMKILNNADNKEMSTAKLTVKSTTYPTSSEYSVSVPASTMNYDSKGSISMSINPASKSTYKYYYYLKIYDSSKEKISQLYYNTNADYSKTYTINANQLSPGTYTIKIINYADNNVMSTSSLTVKSTTYPSSLVYSVKVSDTTINNDSNGVISMKISPAPSSTYKFYYYLRVYDSNNIQKIFQTYCSKSEYTETSYNINTSQLSLGTYTIKIINYADDVVMSTAKLTIKSSSSSDNYIPKDKVKENSNKKDYDIKTYLKAPKMKVKYKSNSYFKIKHYWYWWDDAEPLGGSKLILKVWTGKKTKTYALTTNSKGIAKFNTKKLKLGTHKVKITFKGRGDYKAKSIFSKIIVKKATKTAKKTTTNKKSSSKYKVITTNAKYYTINKKSGKFKVTTFITDFTVGIRAPYKCIDVFLYKNGNLVKNTKYSVKYKLDGKWTGWTKYGITATSHHRNYVYDGVNVQKIKVKVKK